jgi:hypothetical protein
MDYKSWWQGCWIGPFDIKVRNFVPHVPAKDGINKVNQQNIIITNIGCTVDLSEDDYKNKYCHVKKDGLYYYNVLALNYHNLYFYIGLDGKHVYCNIYDLYKNQDTMRKSIREKKYDDWFNGYWTGPYDIRVQNSVPYVPDIDGINRVTREKTYIFFVEETKQLTKKQYQDKFCYTSSDGCIWYNALIDNDHNKYVYIGDDFKPYYGNVYEVYKTNTKMNYVKQDDDDRRCIIL